MIILFRYNGIRLGGLSNGRSCYLYSALTELRPSRSGNTYCGQHQSSLVRLEQDVVGLKEMRCSQVERPLCTSWCCAAVGLDLWHRSCLLLLSAH